MNNINNHLGYGSAKDLPSYVELIQQIKVAKKLTWLVTRNQGDSIKEIEKRIIDLMDTVDVFYERLGERNWIFTDCLSVENVREILDKNSVPAEVEKKIIELYSKDRGILNSFTFIQLRNIDGLQQRFHLLEKARRHYFEGCFDSCTQHLIAVMDGFVNDFDKQNRKGLHSKDEDEMIAWDSVVGHHLGLTHSLNSYKKGFKKLHEEEVFDVYRNGIEHGNVVRYNNIEVATKAWNMLFALKDWSIATKKSQLPTSDEPGWREIFQKVKKRGQRKKFEAEFQSCLKKSSDPEFLRDPIQLLTKEFLEVWENEQWGLFKKYADHRNVLKVNERFIKNIKLDFGRCKLSGCEILEVSYPMASVAVAYCKGTLNHKDQEFGIRWIYYNNEGEMAINSSIGEWKLASLFPDFFIHQANSR